MNEKFSEQNSLKTVLLAPPNVEAGNQVSNVGKWAFGRPTSSLPFEPSQYSRKEPDWEYSQRETNAFQNRKVFSSTQSWSKDSTDWQTKNVISFLTQNFWANESMSLCYFKTKICYKNDHSMQITFQKLNQFHFWDISARKKMPAEDMCAWVEEGRRENCEIEEKVGEFH